MKYVFLHGLGQDRRAWEAVIAKAALDDTDTPELFDLSDGDITYTSIQKGLELHLDSIKSPFCLCGLSLGAVLALDYARDHAERISSLILIAPQYRTPTWLIDLQNLLFRLMPEKSFSSMGISKRDAIRLSHSMRKLDFSDKLKGLSCPVLILCGEKDKANLKAARKLSQLLPAASFRIIPGAGHEVNVSAPDELSAIIASGKES